MKTLLPILLLLFPAIISAQAVEKHAQVSLEIDRPNLVQFLNENGFEIDHAHKHDSNHLEVIITHTELSMLESLNIQYEVLIQDVAQDFENKTLQMGLIEVDCGLNNFEAGTMGGYHTYDDMIQNITAMASGYPQLVTVFTIGESIEGRLLYAVKISDNVGVDESLEEGTVYYDALTHAREPMGLETVLYYMWTLLENYGTDPKYTYLVDHREMYFVPVVNPDGYVFNQSTNPSGGGLWRKNRRDNGDCIGIDLNRNFGHEWGNPAGSSNSPCANTYHGESPFSEPETAAVRDFTNAIQPAAAYSCHTYSDVFLCPNGFNDELDRYEDYAEFASEAMPEFYKAYGNWVQTIGYYGAGTTHDYLNSQGTIAYTPEIGHAFWESPNSICDRIQEMLPSMEYISWIGGDYACFHSFELIDDTPIWDGSINALQVRIKNRGLSKVSQDVSVELSTTNDQITFTSNNINYGDIAPRQFANNEGDPFYFSVGEVSPGEEIEITVKVFQGDDLSYQDVIYIYAGDSEVYFSEDGENGMGQWTVDNNSVWDSTFMDAFNGDHAITDSRYGNISGGTFNKMTNTIPIDLSLTENPWLEFNAKWSLENISDNVKVRASSDGGNTWELLSGKHTTDVNGSPLYTNTKHWVQERMDLLSYAGLDNVLLQFIIQTDNTVHGDGFYFDDLKVIEYLVPEVIAVEHIENFEQQFKIFPNPSQDILNIHLQNDQFDNFEISLFDIQGKAVFYQKENNKNTVIDLETLSNGVYWIRLANQNYSTMKKVVIVK